ncbi:helix-turn-helix transcriptional regulator [Paenibacillus tritici]|jgi:putative transcriptional regulator|uniref:helix-turn-helix transcriptional regulator n=1 Tax=Paenibacillus tritici TaxID=1873425 RepID=UPI001BAC9C7C|nr:helix-turn-helix transcriptional regulator [Paenibacillus tritici]QUL54969.1 helix-turn-helix transcriptional regulator [Paenibacillus tritici]
MGKVLVGNYIRKLRFDLNEMTQQQLADKVGVTRQTIVALEKGNYSPSLELAFRIARTFNLPLEEVFFYGENSEEPSGK